MTLQEKTLARGVALHCDDSPEQQAEAVAARIIAALQAAIDQRGSATLALSGGRGPALFLRRLEACRLDWEKVTITQVDERWVPPGHEDSNAGLIQGCLPEVLQRAVWLPLYRGRGLQEDAQSADQALQPLLPLDVVVLGMGPDGHTASLFPHMPGLEDYLSEQTIASCVAVPAADDRLPRLTMTGRALHTAGLKILAISGEEKRRKLMLALDQMDPAATPIAAFFNPPMDIFYSPDGASEQA